MRVCFQHRFLFTIIIYGESSRSNAYWAYFTAMNFKNRPLTKYCKFPNKNRVLIKEQNHFPFQKFAPSNQNLIKIKPLLFLVIPQTCKFKGRRFECGLSISCVLSGGRPVDLCSGGMIWSCCVDRDVNQDANPTAGAVHNASK